MMDPRSHDTAEIESLLATRQQLTEWLARLPEAGSRAPELVRSKVRADYEGRLAQVVAQLSTHRDVISTNLEGLRAQSREFGQLRGEEVDIRAEAELRHAVGEYSDDEWQLVERESSGKIAGFDQEIERLAAEIDRLAEVQALITPETVSPSNPPAPERRPAPVPSTPRLVTEEPDPPPPPPPPQPRPEAPRFVPRSGPLPREMPARPAPRVTPPPSSAISSQATGSGSDDELAFLRSVNLEFDAPANPSSPANGGGASSMGVAAEPERKPGQPAAKTLKCGECGSLNRPTEWYCERCGAELAAV